MLGKEVREMTKVMMTDGLLRKTLSATRSLGSKGIQTIVGEKAWFSPSSFSKYCSKRETYPDPVIKPELFLNWLYKWLGKENAPVFIPMDDAVMEIAIENYDVLKKVSKCLLPSKRSYDIASDKYKTMKLAAETMINCPATFLANNEEELREIAEMPLYPLIVKPRKSSGSRGIRKVYSKEELVDTYQAISSQYPNPLIQECIPLGVRYDVCLLYDWNHEVKASFVQKEIRHFPIEMGPSTAQESVMYDELIEQSIHLLEPLNWRGIVEVEYMLDPRTNQPILMEINPRFWNSLDLAVRCGVDFPYMLYQICQGEDVPNQKEYAIGRKGRWFPGEILYFLVSPNRLSMNPPLFAGNRQQMYDDTFNLDDPVPGLISILAYFRLAFTFQAWKMFFKR